MNKYIEANPEVWSGRKSKEQLYLHEKVQCINLERDLFPSSSKKNFALLGYACDEGVQLNKGRIGAFDGPNHIRKALAKLPNHLADDTALIDAGTLEFNEGKLENIQTQLSEKVAQLLKENAFPILLGGGHDIAYGHFNGIRNFIGLEKKIGIINFDAHFDLRSNANGNTSGTPFYQIAQDCKTNNTAFNYLCLGIRKDANDAELFKTSEALNALYIAREHFSISYLEHVQLHLMQFIEEVDCIYTTIDLDGFSSAYAPGVSAASPMGFSPDIVLESLKLIIDSKKLVSIDIAEMNPKYDIDNQTSKLAASLVHHIIHQL